MKYFIPIIALLLTLCACDNETVSSKSSPHIDTFGFQAHDSIKGIETITFTVDSLQCIVYNTDSVAYGVSLKKMLPYVTFIGNPSDLKVNGAYWNQVDSLDFSQPVSMYVLSENKRQEATYTINVNQHTVNPEEICWKKSGEIALASTNYQTQTVVYMEQLYCFVQIDEEITVYSSTDGQAWTQLNTNIPSIALPTITEYNQQLYALSADKTKLFTFASNDWRSAVTFQNMQMDDILGQLDGKLWLSCVVNNRNCIVSFDGTNLNISANKNLPTLFGIQESSKTATEDAMYLIGGSKDGQLYNSVLSSDNGTYWTNILNTTGEYDFSARKKAASCYYFGKLYVFSGIDQNGNVLQDGYFSNNYGYSWESTPAYQQLPEAYEFTAGTQAVCFAENIFLIGPDANNPAQVAIWKGRINKADFLIR